MCVYLEYREKEKRVFEWKRWMIEERQVAGKKERKSVYVCVWFLNTFKKIIEPPAQSELERIKWAKATEWNDQLERTSFLV